MPIQTLIPESSNLWLWRIPPQLIIYLPSSIEIFWGGEDIPKEPDCSISCDYLDRVRYNQPYWLTISIDCLSSSCVDGSDSLLRVPTLTLLLQSKYKRNWLTLECVRIKVELESYLEQLNGRNFFCPKKPIVECGVTYPFDTRSSFTSFTQQLSSWDFESNVIGSFNDFLLFSSDPDVDPCARNICIDVEPGWYVYLEPVSLGGVDLENELIVFPIRIFPPYEPPLIPSQTVEEFLAELASIAISAALTSLGIPFDINAEGNFVISEIEFEIIFKLCPLTCPPGFSNQQGVCVEDTPPQCPDGYTLVNGVCQPTQPLRTCIRQVRTDRKLVNVIINTTVVYTFDPDPVSLRPDTVWVRAEPGVVDGTFRWYEVSNGFTLITDTLSPYNPDFGIGSDTVQYLGFSPSSISGFFSYFIYQEGVRSEIFFSTSTLEGAPFSISRAYSLVQGIC